MRNKKTIVHNFICLECGKKGIPVPRKEHRLREKGHIKNLYCIYCKKETQHIEVREG